MIFYVYKITNSLFTEKYQYEIIYVLPIIRL